MTSQAVVNEPGLESVSTTQNSDNPTSVISTTAQQHSISGTSIAHHVLEPYQGSKAIFSSAFGPPPLIPAVYHASSINSVSLQRPLTTTLFTPRNQYESPTNTYLNPMT